MPHRAAAACLAIAVLFFGDSLAAWALRAFRLPSFSRAAAAALVRGGAFLEGWLAEVNDRTISKATSFMERDSSLLERFGMGVVYTPTISEGKLGTMTVLIFQPPCTVR